jgi:F-type H+-transporting ATPase subunit epsilon
MAEQKTLHVTIAKVDAPVFDGEAVSVTVPGKEGEMTILPRHTAILSPLRKGKVIVKTLDSESEFACEGGTMEMSGNDLTILI